MKSYEQFHFELLELQRRMRLLRLRTPSGMEPVAAITLPFFLSRKGASVSDVGEFLSMDSGNTTRTVQKLVNLGFLRLCPSPNDGRVKIVEVTELGGRVGRQAVRHFQYLAEVGMYPLTPKERERVGLAFRVVSDFLNAPRDEALDGEELFTVEQRRLGRATGMAGTNYLDSGYDIGSFQIFNTLFQASEPVRFSAFAERIPLEKSVTSRRVEQLTCAGLIVKTTGELDKRSVLLSLSKRGQELFRSKYDSTSRRFAKGVASLKKEHFQETLSLLERCRLIEEERTAKERCEIIQDKEGLYKARAFLVEQYVRTGRHRKLESTLLPESSLVIAFTREGEIRALAAIAGGELTAFELEPSLKQPPKLFLDAIKTKAPQAGLSPRRLQQHLDTLTRR